MGNLLLCAHKWVVVEVGVDVAVVVVVDSDSEFDVDNVFDVMLAGNVIVVDRYYHIVVVLLSFDNHCHICRNCYFAVVDNNFHVLACIGIDVDDGQPVLSVVPVYKLWF